MTKIKRRAVSVLVLIFLLLAGLGFFVYRYFEYGEQWASFSANQTIYDGGKLRNAAVTDRSGTVLLSIRDTEYRYSPDIEIRISTLHAVGDRYGNIGTGAQTVFRSMLSGYDRVSGLYKADEGGTVALSISADLNRLAYRALNGRKGAVAVCDCDTGEILCMVSNPAFDPENPPESMDDPAYEGVYLNRFLSASYTPGSIYKLVTAAAALETIPGLESRTWDCSGSVTYGIDTVTCMGVHGTVDLKGAMAYSCNSAFAQISVEVGSRKLEQTASALGLTSPQTIDGVSTASGAFRASDEDVETAWSGIGQYEDLVCPAGMLRLCAAIANGGEAPALTMLRSSGQAARTRILKQDTAEALAELMHNNVVSAYGADGYPGITMYAKSGTAEQGDSDPHAWFVGFGEKDGRRLAFVVLVENGGYGSSVAGSIAQQVLPAAFGPSD